MVVVNFGLSKLRGMIFCYIILFIFGNVSSQSSTDVKNVHTLLFTTNQYNNLIRPSLNQSNPIEIYIGFTLYGITGIDEIEQKLTTTGWLDIGWTDEFLQWTPASYGGLKYIYVPQAMVWKPDISLQNGFTDLSELGSKFIQVKISYNGMIKWRPFQVFESKCVLDSTYFPFDRQECDLEFVAWSLSREDVFLAQDSDGIELSPELKRNGEWEIVSSRATDELETHETKVKFTIVIERKPLFVIINMITPIILLSVLSIFTFKIPADIGERMGYTITVWLSFAVFLTIVSASLPQSLETTPIISIYIMIQLFMGTFIVIISAVESGVTTLGEEEHLYQIFKYLAIRMRKTKVRHSSICENEKEKDTEYMQSVTWKEAIAALDRCLFWICFLIFTISTIIVFFVAGLKY